MVSRVSGVSEFSKPQVSEIQFRLLVDRVVEYAIFGLDAEGLVTTWNAGAERIKGYRADEIIGQHFSTFYPPDDIAAGVPASELVAATLNGSFEAEGWRVRKDGSQFRANVVITALYDDEHRLTGFGKVTRDVTERRNADRALRESEDRIRLLVDQVVDYAIFGMDTEGRVTTWNTGAERIKGYQAGEIIGRHFSIFYPPDDIAADLPAAELAAATADGSVETEGWRVRKDGSKFWANVVITALYDDEHQLTGFGKVARDVTERRNADRALRESEERGRTAEFESRLAAMVEFSDDAIWSCSRDGTIATWNGGAEHLYGYDAQEMLGRNILRTEADDLLVGGWIPLNLSGEFPDILERIERGERVGHFETQRVRKDGSVVQVSLTVSPIQNATGALTGMSVVARDITERKLHERVLADERRRLHAAEVMGHVGSWEIDLGTHLVTWSDTLFRLYGLDPEDVQGLRRQEFAGVHPDDREMLQSVVDECEHVGTEILTRYRLIRPSDGELRWFEVRGERITDGEGSPRLTGSVIDISEQVWARELLESARDDAVAESLQKSTFLANMSHEIRTPMNGVIGMTGLLLDTALDVNQRDFVDTIRGSGEALLMIINDILDFSKVESGQLVLECDPFDLRVCMETSLAVAAAGDTRGIELLGHLDNRCPIRVIGDVTRVRQVLVNLLGNAMKFTQAGHVLVTIQPDLDFAGGNGLRFSVSDTGIGIPADRLGILFDSYSQVDASTTRIHGGTGLGLAISDRLVRAMGGVFAVESTVGVGSTFSFSIELGEARDSVALGAADPLAKLPGHHALVIDDSQTNRRVLRSQLEGWGMRVSDVESGAESLDLVDSGASFDVAIVDMKMPQMTGEELAVRLSLSEAGKVIPLILVSASRWQLTHSELFTAILTKPVMNARLSDSLIEAIWPREPVRAVSGQLRHGHTQTKPMRVLLVEDNSVNQRVGRLILEKLGHRVDLAGNGLEAVRGVNLVPYDAVFMDIQMPEMNGLDATISIRAGTLPFRQPYIIALTASATVDDQRECLEAGMDEFLTKPVRNDQFRAALERAAAYVG